MTDDHPHIQTKRAVSAVCEERRPRTFDEWWSKIIADPRVAFEDDRDETLARECSRIAWNAAVEAMR